jgi:hypothetical protein
VLAAVTWLPTADDLVAVAVAAPVTRSSCTLGAPLLGTGPNCMHGSQAHFSVLLPSLSSYPEKCGRSPNLKLDHLVLFWAFLGRHPGRGLLKVQYRGLPSGSGRSARFVKPHLWHFRIQDVIKRLHPHLQVATCSCFTRVPSRP